MAIGTRSRSLWSTATAKPRSLLWISILTALLWLPCTKSQHSTMAQPSLQPQPLPSLPSQRQPQPQSQAPEAPRFRPQPGGQQTFLSRPEYEVFYGGQAGPGKTWALVYDALGLQFQLSPLQARAIDIPDYRGVLFRRKTTEFGQLLDEAKKIYPPMGGIFTSQRHGDPGPCFHFPSGAEIFICHMKDESNKEDHQGKEYEYAGFDELPQFTITQYTYIFSRTRSKVRGLFARVRSTGNPVGEGVVWVKKRFIKGLVPLETNWFITEEEPKINPQGRRVPTGTPDALDRVFVPGTLAENAYADPMYSARIKAMGARYERALLKGDWDAFAGDFFGEYDHTTMCVAPFQIPEGWRIFGSLDPGASSPCSFSLHAVDFDHNVYRLFTYYERERAATAHAVAIKNELQNFKQTRGRMPESIVSGTDAFAKQDRYAVISNTATFADAFQAEGLMLQPAKTDRILGWWNMRNLMERKKWFVFKDFNNAFLEELQSAVPDESQPEDIKGRGNDPNVADHSLDEERYLCMAIFTPAEPPPRAGWADTFRAAAEKRWAPGRG